MFGLKTLTDDGTSKSTMTSFGGYNANPSCSDGEFSDELNMSSRDYPILTPRVKFAVNKSLLAPRGLTEDDGLMWIDGDQLWWNNVNMNPTGASLLTSEYPKKMVRMGSNVFILPDNLVYSTTENTITKAFYDAQFSSEVISYVNVDKNGEALSPIYTTEPETPLTGDYLVTKDADGNFIIKYYNGTMWSTRSICYVKIAITSSLPTITENTQIKVSLTSSTMSSEEKANIADLFTDGEADLLVDTYGENYIIVKGVVGKTTVFTADTLRFYTEAKEMAYAVESNNRIWGCSTDGHEIYACKLGDVKSWDTYAGISTDSYAATVGSEGVFTGATIYNTYPVFFKENSMLTVYVSSTGAHSYREIPTIGVQNGSYRSIVSIDNVIYYKAVDGIYAYAGNAPYKVSDALGDEKYTDAVAGRFGKMYVISMKNEKGVYKLFTYDTSKGIWSCAGNVQMSAAVTFNGDMYFISGYSLKSFDGTLLYDGASRESDFTWSAQSGVVGYSTANKKYLKRMNLRVAVPFGSRLLVSIEYDSSGTWEHLTTINSVGTKAVTIPIRLKRCDHFRYKIEGRGDAKIFAIEKIMAEGSER